MEMMYSRFVAIISPATLLAELLALAHRQLKNKQKGNVVVMNQSIGICSVLRPGDFMHGAVRVQVSHMLLITLPISPGQKAELLFDPR